MGRSACVPSRGLLHVLLALWILCLLTVTCFQKALWSLLPVQILCLHIYNRTSRWPWWFCQYGPVISMSLSLSVDSCLIVVDGSVDVTFICSLTSAPVQNHSTYLTTMSVLASVLYVVHHLFLVCSFKSSSASFPMSIPGPRLDLKASSTSQ